MALCIVHFFEITLVGDGFDPRLERQDFIVAGHNCHRPELQSLAEMHRADRDAVTHRPHRLIKYRGAEASGLNGSLGAGQLHMRSDEDGHLARCQPFRDSLSQPATDQRRLLGRCLEHANVGCRPVEDRDGGSAILDVTVHVRDLLDEQTIGLGPDLVRRAVIHA
jgi:hypothetical protein